MKIAIMAYGDAATASTRFRFLQYLPLFERAGYHITVVHKDQIRSPAFWDALKAADLIVNQKCLLRTADAKRVFQLSKPVIFDFDDAIWTRPGKPYRFLTRLRVNRRFNFWLRYSQSVTVANDFLASKARDVTQRVKVIPMALDTNHWNSAGRSPAGNLIHIGWNGSPNNLTLLESVGQPLQRLLGQHANVRLKVFCGKRPNFKFDFDYQAFAPEQEANFVRSLDIGLLPLQQDEYSHGKSPIKALQYLACGATVVGHVNRGGEAFLRSDNCVRIDHETEWEQALTHVVRHSAVRMKLSSKGEQIVKANHGLDQVFQQICEALAC